MSANIGCLLCLLVILRAQTAYRPHRTDSALTNTVATLLGNIFAVMANEEVMAAAKPTASMDLTMKHRLMKAGPAGTLFSILQNKEKAKHVARQYDRHVEYSVLMSLQSEIITQ